MRLAIAQLNPTVGDLEGNKRKAISALEEAKRRGAQLVVFPELFLLGYPPRDLLQRRGFLEAAGEALRAVASASRGIGVVIGHPAEGGPKRGNLMDPSAAAFEGCRKLFNAAWLIWDGEVLGYQAKGRLPSFDVFEEERYFSPAEEARVLEWEGVRVGLSVCEDFWHRDGLINDQIEAGVDMLINISASPYFAGKPTIRWRLGREWAVKGGVPLVYANLVGGQDELVFDGNSFVLRGDGRFLGIAPAFEEGVFTFDLAGEPVDEPREGGTGDIHRAIVLGIRDYLGKNGIGGAVVGVSGGIDSAVVAALAVEALGPERVRLLFLPGPYTSPESREGAAAVARALGAALSEVEITGVFEAMAELLEPHIPVEGVVAENLQARIRGLILMAFANALGYVVLCPGNKSEVAMGYNTLYGDTVGALAPIGDLLKGQVYELARYINESQGREVIPESIFARPPSAELRPGQRDDQDIPPYALLDPILSDTLVENKDLRELERDHGPELPHEVLRRIHRSEYKRKQLPLVIKVSPKSFGIGRRFPITNRFTA